jgi:hypothetical protein
MKLDVNYEDLFDKIGLSDLSPEEKEKRFQEMQDIIEKEVFLRIWEMLSEEDREVFDKTPEDDFLEFFQKKSIDLPSIVNEVAQEYRESIISDMAYFDSKLNNNK